MDESLFTVCFEDPYWVGIIELTVDGSYSVARIVFGSEPTDAQILEYLSKNYPKNVRFTNGLDVSSQPAKYKYNPKRKQREAAQLLMQKRSNTKAQQALQQAYENNKQEKQQLHQQHKDETAELKYLQKVEKKKQKKRGR